MATLTQKRKISQSTAHKDNQEIATARVLSRKRCKSHSNKKVVEKSDDKNVVVLVDPILPHIHELHEKYKMSEDRTSQELLKHLYKLQEIRQFEGHTNFEAASALNVVGSILFHQEDIINAMVFFQEELRIRESLKCCENLSLAVTCNNIGKIHQETGRFQQAIKHYHRALNNSDSAVQLNDENNKVAPESRMLAARLCSIVWYNLGGIYHKLQKHVDAIQAFQKSLKYRKELLGTDHADVACLLFNIAVLQMEQKWLKEAASSMKGFLEIPKSIRANTVSDENLVTTLQRLASLQKSNGNIQQSLEILFEVLTIQRDSTELNFAQRRLDMGTTFRDLAELYHEQDQLGLAIVAAEKSVQSLTAGCPSEFFVRELVSSLLLLGSLTHESSEPMRACSIFIEAIRTIDTTSSRNDCSVSPVDILREVVFMFAKSKCAPVA